MDGSVSWWPGVSAWPALGDFRPASPGPTVWELTPCIKSYRSESASPAYSAGRARKDGQGGDAAGNTEARLCSQLRGRWAEAVGTVGSRPPSEHMAETGQELRPPAPPACPNGS